jgi:GTPase SAR1 family protein
MGCECGVLEGRWAAAAGRADARARAQTAGQERFRSLGRAFYRGADALVLAYDAANPASLETTRSWYLDFCDATGREPDAIDDVVLAAVGCKSDLLSAADKASAHQAAQVFFAELGPSVDAAEQLPDAVAETGAEEVQAYSLSGEPDARPKSAVSAAVSATSGGETVRGVASPVSGLPLTASPPPTSFSASVDSPSTPRPVIKPASPARDKSHLMQPEADASPSLRPRQSLQSISLVHPPAPSVRKRLPSANSDAGGAAKSVPRSTSRLSFAPSTPPQRHGGDATLRPRGRYDSSVSAHSTGASVYHTPRSSTLYTSGPESGPESDADDDADEQTEGARTPTKMNGAPVDAGVLKQELRIVDAQPSQPSDAPSSLNGHAANVAGATSNTEPVPFPSAGSHSSAKSSRRPSHSSDDRFSDVSPAGSPPATARRRSLKQDTETAAEATARKARARQTLYEALPESMDSSLRVPGAAKGKRRASRGPSSRIVSAESGAGVSTLSVASEPDYDAATDDDEEPPPPPAGFSHHLTSSRAGHGVEDLFDSILERVAARWELEEWNERLERRAAEDDRNAPRGPWWKRGGGERVLSEQEREREQVRRGIRIAAGKEPAGLWSSCCRS